MPWPFWESKNRKWHRCVQIKSRMLWSRWPIIHSKGNKTPRGVTPCVCVASGIVPWSVANQTLKCKYHPLIRLVARECMYLTIYTYLPYVVTKTNGIFHRLKVISWCVCIAGPCPCLYSTSKRASDKAWSSFQIYSIKSRTNNVHRRLDDYREKANVKFVAMKINSKIYNIMSLVLSYFIKSYSVLK